jgi:DNA helicase HerA-like ATPase
METLSKEQDFILIIDTSKIPEKQFLAQIDNLIQSRNNEIKGSAVILGEIDQENHALLPCRFPISAGSLIVQPPDGLVSKIISYRGENGIYLGDVITSDTHKEPFLIPPNFLERHVLCVASTGAGKSYTVGVLLEEILLRYKTASVLLFDIHNEYWGLTQSNERSEIEYLDFEDYSPRGFRDNVLIFEKGSLGLGKGFDLPRLRRLVDLTSAQENSLLNIIKEPILFEELLSLIQESNIHTSTRENLISKIHALKNTHLFEKDLNLDSLIRPGQISIIRLDQFTDERKRNLLVNEILALVFEKKILGEIAREQEIVIIIEEAHRFSSATEILPRIAREGRKFGIYEILISQRPGDMPDNIIANMNTLIALRIKSDKDINKIRLMEGISVDTVSVLPHLIRGEALIVGIQSGTHRPIKIRVRPRLSKHVDPQEDLMPEDIPRFSHRTEQIVDSQNISEIEDIKEIKEDDISPSSTDVEPFTIEDLTNLLACQHILILHKNSGICLYELGITMLKIDPQLVSGFLSAISGLFDELKGQNVVKERTIFRKFTEEIGDRAFEIISVEGTYSVTAIILDRTPKYLNYLKKRMRTFVYAFETEFDEKLKGFSGVLDDFISTNQLLDKYLGIALTTPLQINRDYKIEENVHYDDLYMIIKEQMDQLADAEGLFVDEIVNQCILDSDYNYREIIEALVSLIEERIIFPADQERQLPSFSPHRVFADHEQIPFVLDEQEEKELDPKDNILKIEDLRDDVFLEDQKLNEIDIKWFLDIIDEITESSIPDSLKEDILKRNLMFESNFRIKTTSIRTEVFSNSDMTRWAHLMIQKGFILQEKTRNPLNGFKLAMKADFATILGSFALLKDEKYIIVFCEAE